MDEKQVESTTVPTPENCMPLVRTTPTRAVRREYEIDGRDRLLLPLALGVGVLCAELLFTWTAHVPGLIVPALVALWYAVLFWYKGVEGFASRANLFLFGAVCLLSLTFTIYSDPWFRLWNFCALPVLMAVQLFQWSGAARRSWFLPTMLIERGLLLLDGLFARLGAPLRAVISLGKMSNKRLLFVLLGLAITVPVLRVVVPLLAAADALFQSITSGLVDWMVLHLSAWMARLLLGLVLAPFLFGLLYVLRRPARFKEPAATKVFFVDAALPATVLVVMDALYLLFVGVQFAVLFGGAAYLERAGISYAQYARSGFFQLVFVAVLNLTLVLLCLQLCRRSGRGWRVVRVLSTALVTMSGVILASAAWRMTLYVSEYGLSFKRFLTYWGMVMLVVFFVAALFKIWKNKFSFFRVLFTASVAGWLVLNFINVDAIVVRSNIARLVANPSVATLDTSYLYGRSYAVLGPLEELSTARPEDEVLRVEIRAMREWAAEDASHWQTWSVSAQLAALKK